MECNIYDCKFIKCSASNGGAIYNAETKYNSPEAKIVNCQFENNYAQYGGAIYFKSRGIFDRCTFTNNQAAQSGGAVYFKDYGEAHNSIFTSNKALSGLGGAMYSERILISISNSYNNNAPNEVYAKYLFYFAIHFVDGSVAASGDGSELKPWKTLKEAIEKSNFGDGILISPGTYTGPNNIGLSIDKNLNLYKIDNGEVIIDAEGKNYIFKIFDSKVHIDGITFKNGYSSDGGAIWASSGSHIIIDNSSFINNVARYTGGAITAEGYLEVNNCYFKKNRQQFEQEKDGESNPNAGGGAITSTVPAGTLLVSNSVFEENNAVKSAGAIQAGGFVYIDNCTFTKNSAIRGGAIRVYVTSKLMFSHKSTKFINNEAERGGAIFLICLETPAYNLNFTGNKASISGGAIYGMYADNPYSTKGNTTIHFCNCTFVGNRAGLTGGAIGYVTNEAGDHYNSILRFDGCFFRLNRACQGGAIQSAGTLIFEGNKTQFILNSANSIEGGNCGYGGAIMHFGTFEFKTNVDFLLNEVNNGFGGAIAAVGVNGPDSKIENAYFYGNNILDNHPLDEVDSKGGAIYTEHDLTIISCEFFLNEVLMYTTRSGPWDFPVENYPGRAIYAIENYQTKPITLTLIKNNFNADDIIYGGLLNKKGSIYMMYNYCFEGESKENILFASNMGSRVYDKNPVYSKWDFNSDASKLFDILYFSNNNEEIKLDRDYLIDHGETGISLNNNLIIDGQGHTIKGHDDKKIYLNIYSTVTFKNLIFQDLNEFIRILNQGKCDFLNCTFISNDCTDKGIISVYNSGICNVMDSTFINNSAQQGGAIYSENEVHAANCLFKSNTANNGGAIYSRTLSLDSCTFNNNHAESGGAISICENLTIYHLVTFNDNYATDGTNNYILINDAEITLLNDTWYTFTDLQNIINNAKEPIIKLNRDYRYINSDSQILEGIEIKCDNIVIDGQGHTIDGNKLTRMFYVYGNNVTFKNINFINGKASLNHKTHNGGAIYFNKMGTVENCNFENNSAALGGAISFSQFGGYAENCTFHYNSADTNGGAIFCRGDLTINIITFGNNSVTESDNVDYCVKGKLINITPTDTNLSISIANVSEGFPLVVEITTVETFSGNVTVQIANVNYNVTINKGSGNISINGLKMGVYTATAISKSIFAFKDIVKTTEFEIYPKLKMDLNMKVFNINVGENAKIEIITDESFSGLIPIQITEKNAPNDIIKFNYVVVYNGYGSISVSGLKEGNYTVTATSPDTDKFNSNTSSEDFEVKSKDYIYIE